MKTYSIITNGCEALRFDCQKIIESLHEQGLRKDKHEKADLRLIFGCTFTQRQENDLRKLVDNAAKQRKNKQLIVVSGCYLKNETREGVVYARRESIIDLLNELTAGKIGENVGGIALTEECDPLPPFVAISEGCYGNCTFCSIRFVRGRHRSRPVKAVLQDVRRAFDVWGLAKLVGQEIAAYGKDIGITLPGLIRQLFDELPTLRLELGSLGPTWMKEFSNEDLALFADDRIEGNIHIPLQSSSDSVLCRMSRDYTFSEYTDLLSRLRCLGVQCFSTDLIAGFPEETDADHKQNLRFLETNLLEFAQIFMYEPRPGTVAASMNQIQRDVRLKRTLELIATFVTKYRSVYADKNYENLDVNAILNTNIEISREEGSFNES